MSNLLLYLLAACGISYAITQSPIGTPFRFLGHAAEAAWSFGGKHVRYFFECPICIGFWFGGAFIFWGEGNFQVAAMYGFAAAGFNFIVFSFFGGGQPDSEEEEEETNQENNKNEIDGGINA